MLKVASLRAKGRVTVTSTHRRPPVRPPPASNLDRDRYRFRRLWHLWVVFGVDRADGVTSPLWTESPSPPVVLAGGGLELGLEPRVGDGDEGPRPLSEREARVAARLILRVRPRVTIWFHQPQSLVRGWDGSHRAARRYARLVGMRFRALPSPPGAASRWQHRRFPSSEVFVVELPPGKLAPAVADRHARAVLALAG